MHRAAVMSASHRRADIRSPADRDPSEVNVRACGNAPGDVNLATGGGLPQVEIRPRRRTTS
jgi:hypothetical protein